MKGHKYLVTVVKCLSLQNSCRTKWLHYAMIDEHTIERSMRLSPVSFLIANLPREEKGTSCPVSTSYHYDLSRISMAVKDWQNFAQVVTSHGSLA